MAQILVQRVQYYKSDLEQANHLAKFVVIQNYYYHLQIYLHDIFFFVKTTAASQAATLPPIIVIFFIINI